MKSLLIEENSDFSRMKKGETVIARKIDEYEIAMSRSS